MLVSLFRASTICKVTVIKAFLEISSLSLNGVFSFPLVWMKGVYLIKCEPRFLSTFCQRDTSW